ncbi:MAG: RNA methyltransferase PUA domain-containing protein, partial [Acidobacteriota bacterium]
MKHRVHVPRLGARDEELTVDGPEFHHTIHVVRARVGEELELFDGMGR